MVEHNPPPHADRVPLIPLPIALYVSAGLVFELYDGGQPYRRFSIRWERLVPTKESQPEPAPSESASGLAHTATLIPVFDKPLTANFQLIANEEK